MDKKKLAGGVAAALLLGVGVAYGVGGSQSDPLISFEYLQNTVQPSLLQQIDRKIEASVSASYQKAADQLNAGTGGNGVGLTQKTQHRKDSITLSQGSMVLLTAGSAAASVSNGQLIDATTGTASSSVSLMEGHRYLVGEGATASVTLTSDTAKLMAEGNFTIRAAGETVTPFTDLSNTDWYYSYVTYAYQKGLLSGVSADSFAPKTPVTRAMLATVLYRLADSPSMTAASPFTDVPAGQWYSTPVTWAVGAGVVNGVGNGQFAPTNPITREQLAVMLRNYALSYLGQQDPGNGSTASFRDDSRISSWARDSVRWAVGQGILTGREDGRLDPAGTATRAEVCTMLQRFIKACL